MNANDQFPTDPKLDRMLSAFFKAELPSPFPALKMPSRAELPLPAVSPSGSRAPLSNSRLSLAASVALIIGGCWYLSGQITNPVERPSLGKGDDSAKLPSELQKAQKDELKGSTMP
jgi:hypothetical protein